MSNNKIIKCVIIGDNTAGKSSLLQRYAQGDFNLSLCPTLFGSKTIREKFKEEIYNIKIFDTAINVGEENYDEVRKTICDEKVNVILICFAVDDEESFKNVTNKWLPEIEGYASKIPFVLVATQIDKRSDDDFKCILKNKGEELAASIQAAEYIETSAKTGENINAIFKKVLEIALNNKSSNYIEDSNPYDSDSNTKRQSLSRKLCSCCKY